MREEAAERVNSFGDVADTRNVNILKASKKNRRVNLLKFRENKKGAVASMVDVQSNKIHENDIIVFIRNERGERPRLVDGVVKAVNDKSIIVQLNNGDACRLSPSRRSLADERMNNVVVIHSAPYHLKG